MVKAYSKPLDETIQVDRIIGKVDHGLPGPQVVFFCGMHGNETAGVVALKRLMDEMAGSSQKLHGTLIALAGNLNALGAGRRFINADLNRAWHSVMPRLSQPESDERDELLSAIENIIKDKNRPLYFFDIHTTSSPTVPFVTINDTLLNRDMAKKFPVPVVLGIEEFLRGPLLSYINDLGYLAVGFEAGQHDKRDSIDNARAFARMVLRLTKAIPDLDISNDRQILKSASGGIHDFFEITYRYELDHHHKYATLPGFSNFDEVTAGEQIGTLGKHPVESPETGKIFMPLYQEQGDEAFFIVKKIRRFSLWVSRVVRRIRLDRVLVLLPGVSWHNEAKTTIIMDQKVARFFRRDIMHLLGYRYRENSGRFHLVSSREAATKRKEYR